MNWDLVPLLAAGFVAYTYAGYPALLALGTRLRRRPPQRGPFAGSVTILVAAYNEAPRIAPRMAELHSLLDQTGLEGEVLLVSDGSTDGTAERAREQGGPRLRVLELPANAGKAAALSAGVAAARGDVIVFADARQSWSSDTLPRLLESFADPTIGAVSGDLIVQSPDGAVAGVGLYWRYEKWIRQQESLLASAVGVSGSIAAVRRPLFRPIPPKTLLDDVYWPLQVARQGYRVVHDPRVHAYDRLPTHPRDEWRRKVRTLCGNFQLVARDPSLLLPVRNPLWWQFASHKLCRLLVPWALLTLLVSSLLLAGPIHRVALLLQLLFYALGLIGLHLGVRCRTRVATTASSFLLLNAAAWLAFWVWISGRTDGAWRKVQYAAPASVANS